MKTLKTIVAVFLSVLLIVSIASVAASAAEPNSEDDFVFKKTSAGAVINKYIGERENVVIPDKLDGENVVKINKSAFEWCEATSVTMPDTVTEIADYAFYGCLLKKIALSANLKKIGVSAFSETSLTSVKIPSKVTKIPNNLFADCYKLKSIILPSGITSIGKYAFYDTKITSFKVPAKVTSLSEGVVSGCRSLKSIKLHSGIKSIGDSAVSGTAITSFKVPSKVTSIPDNVFSDCTKLKSVKLHSKIKSIGTYAFSFCRSLKSISIPSKVSAVKDGTFSECKSLKSVKMSKKVKSIGQRAFSNTGISSLKLSKSVTKIAYASFANCKSLKSVSISKGLKSLREAAFDCCSKLKSLKVAKANKTYKSSKGIVYNKKMTKLVSFPSGKGGSYTISDKVSSIANGAFNSAPLKTLTLGKKTKFTATKNKYGMYIKTFGDLRKLKAFKVKSSNKNYSTKKGVLFNKKGTKLLSYPANKGSKYKVPSGVTEIGNVAFFGMSMKSITVPASVKKIGVMALGWPDVICGKKGSAAHKYAKDNYIDFKAI